MHKKVKLMILDGWGIGTNSKVSAIAAAHTPFIDSLFSKYPHSKLEASGLAVGLPEGQMGNSEVGHMNLGAGRVVYQDLVKINKAAKEGMLSSHPLLVEAFAYAKKKGCKVHFMGLVSNGGVHAHIDHLKALCDAAKANGIAKPYIHAFTDGRDTDPKSGLHFITELDKHLQHSAGTIATIIGRYYAMDRDNRWERVKFAYDAMVHGTGFHTDDVKAALLKSYGEDITDEFVKPIIKTDENRAPVGKIATGDVVICFNFRTDRGREISQALTQKDFPEQGMKMLDIHYITFTKYDDTFKGVKVLYEKDNLNNTLGEVLAAHGKKQIRIAETEKYPHVTFFFSGGRETEFEGETRLLCSSPKVATYDLQPEMSAADIADSIIPELQKEKVDFVCLNFANADMVGHTGVFSAAVKACEAVDREAKRVIEQALASGYTTIVIADHGNSDIMINPDGSPNTAHTTNLVPCIMVDGVDQLAVKDGKLGDLAPTILNLMGIGTPEEMTGEVLLSYSGVEIG
jgi:2,3-bisphosphoglycerate-independent phosphoglycerate mutase